MKDHPMTTLATAELALATGFALGAAASVFF